jgi:uncharacterized membrane protein (UPF0127 family)
MVKFSGMVKTVEASGAKASEPLERGLYVFSSSDGERKAGSLLQIADTYDKKRKGLSGRDSLEPFGGMVFPGSRHFWMKDTNFPLDLVYSDDNGNITEILGMTVDKSGGTTYSSSKPESRDAYELPAGFCKKNGICVGDRIERKKLRNV